MKRVKPGQSVHIAVTSQKAGVLTDAAALVLLCHFPDGTTVAVPNTRDSLGTYHGDVVVPLTCPPGVAVARGTNTVADASANANREERFYVEPLDF